MGPLPSWQSPPHNLVVMGLEARPGAEVRSRVVLGGAACCLHVRPVSRGFGPKPCDARFLAKLPVDTRSCPPAPASPDTQLEFTSQLHMLTTYSLFLFFLKWNHFFPLYLLLIHSLNSHLNVIIYPSETRVSWFALCESRNARNI